MSLEHLERGRGVARVEVKFSGGATLSVHVAASKVKSPFTAVSWSGTVPPACAMSETVHAPDRRVGVRGVGAADGGVGAARLVVPALALGRHLTVDRLGDGQGAAALRRGDAGETGPGSLKFAAVK